MTRSLVTVRDYLRLVFRRKWQLFVPTLGGLLMIPVLLRAVPQKYRAAAVVRRQDMAILRSTPSSLINKTDSHISVAALRAEILTWTNLEKVIRQTNLDTGLQTLGDWQDMYSQLRAGITIDTIAKGRGRDLIEISVIHRDPDKGAEIANAVADSYVEQTQGASRTSTQTAVTFLRDGTEEYRKKLREAERKLQEYRQTHFADLPNVREGILSKLLSLRTQMTTEELQLTRAESRLESVKNQLREVPEIVEGEVTRQENPILADLQTQLAERERLLRSLSLNYTDQHPRILELEREIAELQKQIEETPARIETEKKEVLNPEYQDLQMQKRKLQQDIEAHQAALNQIQAQVEANNRQLRSLTEEEQRYNDLQREKREAEQLYEQYNQSLASAQTRLEVESKGYETEAEVIARAQVPQSPYRVLSIKLAAMSLAGGLALGVGLIFASELTDRSFRNIEDAADYLGVPVLGSIPAITTPEQIASRRRRRIKILLLLVVLALLAGGAVVTVEHLQPGLTREFLREVPGTLQRWFNRAVSMVS